MFEENRNGLYLAEKLTSEEIQEVLQGLHPDKTFIFPTEIAQKYLGDPVRCWKALLQLKNKKEKQQKQKEEKDRKPTEVIYRGEPLEIKKRRLYLRELELKTKLENQKESLKLLREVRDLLKEIREELRQK